MRTQSRKRQEGFIELQIQIGALKNLLTKRALYIEDIHCSDNADKRLLQQLLMMSVMPDKQT